MIMGIGFKSDVNKEDILEAIGKACEYYHIEIKDINLICVLEEKANIKGFIEASNELNIPILKAKKEDLQNIKTLSDSDISMQKMGIGSVCEALALLFGFKLLGTRYILNNVTIAFAKN